MLSCVCVLRSGGEYTPEHVKALHAQVQRFWPLELPLRFVALTDVPINRNGIEERPLHTSWRGWWSKMELFSAAQDDLGDILYFDLDTMIVGRLDDIVLPRPLTLLSDFYRLERVQSGMMYLPIVDRPEACAAWLENPNDNARRARGDGEFLDMIWRHKAVRWQDTLPDQVVSYKVHVRRTRNQAVSNSARVVCFHGQPRPWTTPLWERFA